MVNSCIKNEKPVDKISPIIT